MNKLNVDIVIIGAGIAGLWLHNRLNDLGYYAILIDKQPIGGTQTLSSQGIIHGGAKYTLNGILSNAASAIADMPKRWLDCLAGKGEINLSDTQVLSTHQLMWSTQSLSSKLSSFFSSKALNSKIKPLSSLNHPEPFNDTAFEGLLYALNEPVLDVPTLICNLAKKWSHRIMCTNDKYTFTQDNIGNITSIRLNDIYTIMTKECILTSGEGTQKLLQQLDIQSPKMQTRPLHMVLAKGAHLPKIYSHCIGASTKPIATITTHLHSDGDHVWYIGGGIAENGVKLEPNELIEKTQSTIHKILPWINIENTQWTSHRINRAEPLQKNKLRPDTAFVESTNNIHIAWPTKLALTPDLGDRIERIIKNKIQAISNEEQDTNDTLIKQSLVPATLSINLWEKKFNAKK